jgi:hypothetical protein
MKVDGACACGAIKVEAEADPEKTQVCHCTDCQTATGTAFRVSTPVWGVTFKNHRQAGDLCKDHGRERPPPRAGVLRHLRLADLFDHAR